MTIDVDAVYEDGVLKPERPLDLKDKSRVHVTIETKDDGGAPAPQGGSAREIAWKDALAAPVTCTRGDQDKAL